MRYAAFLRLDQDSAAVAPRACAVMLVLLLVVALLARPGAAGAAPPEIVLGTTTALQATGLLDAVIPPFEQQSGYRVKTIAVSSPQAISLGVRGEVDLLLIDSPEEERSFVAAGHGVERRPVMHEDLVFVGPRSDPDGLATAGDLDEALRRVANGTAYWVSRADNSTAYQIERKLWAGAGIDPQGQPWYVEIGQGIVGTLAAASERQAYTLADRRTMLERQGSLDLAILAGGFPDLLDLYHVIVVNPAKGPWLDGTGARALADYLLVPATQDAIGRFGVDRLGQAIFTPDAGRTEEQIVPSAGR